MTSEGKQQLSDWLKTHIAGGGPFEITAQQLASDAGVEREDATSFLESLAAAGVLKKETRIICGCSRDEPLEAEQAGLDTCIHCGLAFGEDVKKPRDVVLYVHDAPVTRDVPWVLTLHGMNTLGPWQEELMWRVSRTYGHSVPVAIYKYGLIRSGAILKFRLRTLTDGLSDRIRRLSGDARQSGFGGTPDVVAHSLGTWLLGHALEQDETLRIGRVILTGCILRPDFKWVKFIERGQVESVLCHVATKDFWAWITHYVIPDSGPSGRRGFDDRTNISHVVFPGKGHSDFFKVEEMPALFDGVWEGFLTGPVNSPVMVAADLPAPAWKQTWWPLRATLTRFAVLAVALTLVLAVAAAFLIGAVDLWRGVL